MNTNKVAISIICVAILWFGLDFVIHSILLMPLYQQTMHLWRPMAEMSPAVGLFVVLIHSILFVLFYQSMVTSKSLSQGMKFGCWYGVLSGFMMAASYRYMPIPAALAAAWFFFTWLECFVAGGVVGYFLKDA